MSEETKDKVKFICKILSLLPSLVFLGTEFIKLPNSGLAGDITFWIIAALLVIGWVATLMTGPIKVLKKMFKPVAAVWSWGTALFFPWGILIGLFGAIFVLWFMLFAFVFIPFVFTWGN